MDFVLIMRKLLWIFSVMLGMGINVHSMNIFDYEACRECPKRMDILNTFIKSVRSSDFIKLILPLIIKKSENTIDIDVLTRNSEVIPIYHKKFSCLIVQDSLLNKRHIDNMPVSVIELALQIIK